MGSSMCFDYLSEQELYEIEGGGAFIAAVVAVAKVVGGVLAAGAIVAGTAIVVGATVVVATYCLYQIFT